MEACTATRHAHIWGTAVITDVISYELNTWLSFSERLRAEESERPRLLLMLLFLVFIVILSVVLFFYLSIYPWKSFVFFCKHSVKIPTLVKAERGTIFLFQTFYISYWCFFFLLLKHVSDSQNQHLAWNRAKKFSIIVRWLLLFLSLQSACK